jgi:phosphoglycolate phosphatase-like HAD superfamily hydrolase
MKSKAAIFDVDGTLVHTPKGYIYRVVGETLSALGRKGVRNEYIERFWFGMDRERIIAAYFHVDPEKFFAEFRRKDTGRAEVAMAYDDVDVLDELRDSGYRLGIVTGAPLEIFNRQVALIGREKFDEVVIANPLHGRPAKPHPHALEECLDQMGVEKDNAVYIGNGEEDFLTAQRACVTPILINRGEFDYSIVFSPEVKLPRHVLTSLYQLGSVLERIELERRKG